MRLLIPFNSDYLRKRYHLSLNKIDMLISSVMPDLTERLAMDRRIISIDVFSNVDLTQNLCLSTKITQIQSDTDNLITGEEVILRYFELSEPRDDDVCVLYNPMFPFISISKLENAYLSVKENSVSSAAGSFSTSLRSSDESLIRHSDHGIFSVFRESTFKKYNKRLVQPVDLHGLSAIESICLRTQDDYELFGLIKNSGLS